MELTPQCRQMIRHGREAMARFGHASLSSSHLLLGIMKVGRGPAAMLKEVGLSLDMAEGYIQTHSPPVENPREMWGVLVGESATIALEGAELLAASMNCRCLGTHHVLLAICDRNGTDACDLFQAHSIDNNELRQLLVKELATPASIDFYEIHRLLDEIKGD